MGQSKEMKATAPTVATQTTAPRQLSYCPPGRKMHARDTFHAFMVRDARFEGLLDMPVIIGSQSMPQSLIPFSVAMNPRCRSFESYIHFYEDDFRFERFWSSPRRYVCRISMFAGIITPDFSTCTDFPGALKVWNTYRDRASGCWLQSLGIPTIPNVRCNPHEQSWCLDGLPRHSVIAFGSRACVKNVSDRRCFTEGVRRAVDVLAPSGVVWYGSHSYGTADYLQSRGIPVAFFPAQSRGNLGNDANV